jgi:hypothetical protein
MSAFAACTLQLWVTPSVAAESREQARERTWIQQASAGLDARARDTLSRISDSDRQLLALRAYLRAGTALSDRWSWSQEQLVAYPATAEGKAAFADIDAVERAFAAANPGFIARANRIPRSLELQISHWNENRSVKSVATDLKASLEHQFPRGAKLPGADQIRVALRDWKPSVAATLAAPGLSAHGQGRAFDFQIERNGQTIAGFEASAAQVQWDAKGWTEKLHAAVAASGKPFVGPLQSPYEPWHYAYAPADSRSRM